jgi:SanA protein
MRISFFRPLRFRAPSRRTRRVLGSIALVTLLLGCTIYAQVQRQGQPIYRSVARVPAAPVAIVFGAGIANAVIDDRVMTAVELYKAGKVRKLLMTGDNGRTDYDEPDAMRATAVAAGVPAGDVVCDYAGFRTYDSLYRARDIFGVHQAVLVTQGYHLPRALYLGRQLGLSVVGLDAARRQYGDQRWFDLREVGAVETAWLDVHLHRKPKYLGKRVALFW